MRLLLDTHALLWWLADDPALSAPGRTLISSAAHTVLVSAASAWEIATKVWLGKLPSAADLAADFASHLARERFEPLAVTVDHGTRAGLLPGPLRDPFDRMLIAQSLAENVPIISRESVFDSYSVRRVW